MAKIRPKSGKRYRVQITVNKDVWETYNSNQQIAAQLKVEIDYSSEFSSWLSRQNEQVAQELEKLKQHMLKQKHDAADGGSVQRNAVESINGLAP